MTTLYEEDPCPGEKHKGKTIGEVAAIDPGYLHVLQEHSKNFCISDEVMDNLDKYRNFNAKASYQTTGHSIKS
jgi:hypothetical protein